MLRKLFTTAGLIVASVFVAGAQGQGVESVPSSVCASDQSLALALALDRHKHMIGDLMHVKGISRERAYQARSLDLREKIETFLDGRVDEGLLLYAQDAKYLCSFLWVGADKPLYVRVENADRNLKKFATRVASSIIHEGVNRSSSVKDRVASLRRVEEVEDQALLSRASESQEAPEAAIKEISGLLFPPAMREQLAKVKHLTIVPVGAISSLPIAALHPLGSSERVIDRFSVNLLLFATSVAEPRRPWSAKFTSPLIIGNPAGSDVFFSSSPLPAAEREARYVAEKFRTLPMLGKDANSHAFHTRVLGADLLYFATHGVSTSSGAMDPLRQSFIVLADNRIPGSTILSIGAFPEPHLSARLVVLSACQSGLGWVTEGGVIGLARTFLDGGAGNVVMTTWNVDDEATEFLMKQFVDLIGDHQPSEALRLAQKAAASDPKYADLVYWSGFNVYGNPFDAW